MMPISLQEARAWLRVDHGADDPDLMRLIYAATEAVEDHTGLVLIERAIAQSWPAFETPLRLNRRPLVSVESLSYLDLDGATVVLDSSSYHVAGAGNDREGATIQPALGLVWPATAALPDAVSVSFVAGYGPDWNSTPESIRHALAMMVHAAYDFRSDAVAGTVTEVPHASRYLLRRYRPAVLA